MSQRACGGPDVAEEWSSARGRHNARRFPQVNALNICIQSREFLASRTANRRKQKRRRRPRRPRRLARARASIETSPGTSKVSIYVAGLGLMPPPSLRYLGPGYRNSRSIPRSLEWARAICSARRARDLYGIFARVRRKRRMCDEHSSSILVF